MINIEKIRDFVFEINNAILNDSDKGVQKLFDYLLNKELEINELRTMLTSNEIIINRYEKVLNIRDKE